MQTFIEPNSDRAFRLSTINHTPDANGRNHHTPFEFRQERWNPETLRFEITHRAFLPTASERDDLVARTRNLISAFFPTFKLVEKN